MEGSVLRLEVSARLAFTVAPHSHLSGSWRRRITGPETSDPAVMDDSRGSDV